jgi:hypothetical protein
VLPLADPDVVPPAEPVDPDPGEAPIGKVDVVTPSGSEPMLLPPVPVLLPPVLALLSAALVPFAPAVAWPIV